MPSANPYRPPGWGHSGTKTSQNAVTPLTDFGEAERYETGMQVRLRREDPNENNIDRD